MRYDLIQFQSLTCAQRGASTLQRAGISAYILRCPNVITSRGCSYCVRIPDRRREKAKELLCRDENGSIRFYVTDGDGIYKEAEC